MPALVNERASFSRAQAASRLLTTPFVVFINPTYTPKADFPVSSFLGEHGRSPPGEGLIWGSDQRERRGRSPLVACRRSLPFDGLKKAGGSKGTRPIGRPLGLAGFRLHPAPEADASGFIFRLYAGAATSGSAGGGQPPEWVQATAWGEAPRLYSCSRSLLLFQRPWGDFVNSL